MIMIGSVPAVKPAESVSQPAKLFALCFSHCVIGVLAMRAVVAEAPTPFESVLLESTVRTLFFQKPNQPKKNTCQEADRRLPKDDRCSSSPPQRWVGLTARAHERIAVPRTPDPDLKSATLVFRRRRAELASCCICTLGGGRSPCI